MTEIILKGSVAIAISYLLYYCFLRNNMQFRWLRIYFLVTVTASVLIPLLSQLFKLKQEIWIEIPATYLHNFVPTDGATNSGMIANDWSLTFSLSRWLPRIYFAGATMVLLRFVIGLAHLLFLTIKFGIQRVGTDRLVILQNLAFPFSFLHLIFINRQTLSDGSNGAMLQHERAHVQQWHSLDLMVLELLVAFQWFNPFAWLLRRSVKELHEYLADEEVLRHQPSRADYQLLLFNQACGTSFYKPVNGFKSSLTKKRMLMITNNNKTKRWFAAFISLIVVIVAIQSLSRVNIAQDPPKTLKADTHNTQNNESEFATSPSHCPLFAGTSTFEESTKVLGEYLMKNAKLPESFVKSTTKNGIFLRITFSKEGKVTKVQHGYSEFAKQIQGVKISDYASFENEIARALYSAPNFKMSIGKNLICDEINCGFVFQNNTCTPYPHAFLYHKLSEKGVEK